MLQQGHDSDYESRPEMGRRRNDDSDIDSNENHDGDITYAGPSRIRSPCEDDAPPPAEDIRTVSNPFMRKPIAFGALGTYATGQDDQSPARDSQSAAPMHRSTSTSSIAGLRKGAAFRVQGYVNEAASSRVATPQPTTQGIGPYGAQFRAELPAQPARHGMDSDAHEIDVQQIAAGAAHAENERILRRIAGQPQPAPPSSTKPRLQPHNRSPKKHRPAPPAFDVADSPAVPPSPARSDRPFEQALTPASSYASAPTPASHAPSPASSAHAPLPRAHGAKPRLLTVLIDDRRTGVDELAEILVPLTKAEGGEGGWWADARDVCEKLQGGPSRIDGPAKVFTMRGKYRQTFLRISAANAETSQSANLKVEKNKTLAIFVESLSIPAQIQAPIAALNAIPEPSPSQAIFTRKAIAAPSPAPAQQPLSPPFSSASPSITDEHHRSPSRASKRKRESSAQLVQQRQYSNPTPMPSSTSAPPKKTKRAKPAAERPQPDFAAESMRAPTPVQKRMRDEREQQQPPPRPSTAASTAPPAPAPDDALLLTSYLRPKLMQDSAGWAELCAQKHRRVSSEQMVRLYWFVQRAMEAHVDTTYMGVRIDMEHVAAALEVAPEWYEQGRQTLALLLLYGRGGTQYEDGRVLEAMAYTAPAAVPGSDPTPLLELLRAVHEEWMANSVEDESEIQEVAG